MDVARRRGLGFVAQLADALDARDGPVDIGAFVAILVLDKAE
jgi:hypothetical protein